MIFTGPLGRADQNCVILKQYKTNIKSVFWGIRHRNGRTALNSFGHSHLPSAATLSLPASPHSAFDGKLFSPNLNIPSVKGIVWDLQVEHGPLGRTVQNDTASKYIYIFLNQLDFLSIFLTGTHSPGSNVRYCSVKNAKLVYSIHEENIWDKYSRGGHVLKADLRSAKNVAIDFLCSFSFEMCSLICI